MRIYNRLKFKFYNRSLRITKEGFIYIIITLGIGIAALNTGNNLIYLILGLTLSLIIVSGILSEQSIKKIKVIAELPDEIYANIPFSLKLTLINMKKILPSFLVGINGLHFLMLLPGESISRGMGFVFSKRGFHTLDKQTLSTTFPFGFFIKSKIIDLKKEVLVYPEIKAISIKDIFGFKEQTEEYIMMDKKRGIMVRSLREYREGDDTRFIDWKATARLNRFMIKEFEKEKGGRTATVVIDNHDTKINENAFEEAIKIGASIINLFANKEFTFQLITCQKVIGPDKGKEHLKRAMRHLALLKKSLRIMSYELFDSEFFQNSFRILILYSSSLPLAKKEYLFNKVVRIK